MNILWITLESILPANSGGRLGVFKRLEQLAKTENIYLFYPFDDEKELSYVKELENYCKEVHPYNRKNNKKHAIFNLLKLPYTVASRNIPAMQDDIRKCLEENQIDIINVDFPHMCISLLKQNIEVPIVLNEHNVEWKVYRTIASSKKNVIMKFAYWIDSYRLKWFEKKIFQSLPIKMVTFVSEKDMEYMIKSTICSQESCVLIPVGADVRESNRVKKLTNVKNIIFVGKMSYGPNVEAVTWFVKNILPVITKENRQIKFYIVGKDPTDEVKVLASENVIVTGIVESVEEYYELADLVVLPLQNGGGVKVKLLEAISYKKHIVSTPVGVEGTIYANGETIPVCDSIEEFAKWCEMCLEEPDTFSARTASAYEIFCEKYTWKNIGEKYRESMKTLL